MFAKEVASARIRIGEEISNLTRAAKIFEFFYTKDKSLVSENCQLVAGFLEKYYGMDCGQFAMLCYNLKAIKEIGDTLHVPRNIIDN